jgi:hypothetical protein
MKQRGQKFLEILNMVINRDMADYLITQLFMIIITHLTW